MMKKVVRDAMRDLVRVAVRKTWNYISADVDWKITTAGAAELCLDAGRLLTHGGITPKQHDLIMALPNATVDRWAREALKGMVD